MLLHGKGNVMGIFSKIFGGDDEAAKALEKLKDIVNAAEKEVNAQKAKNPDAPFKDPLAGHTGTVVPSSKPVQAQNIVSPDYQAPSDVYNGPSGMASGNSWGPNMPKEPNQFNYHGKYDKYFREIFRDEFTDYDVTEQKLNYSRPATMYTFFKGGQKVLVVEVISENTDVYALRNKCRAEGTPYLRYYHDHDGWWNTRSYVIERTRSALQLSM